MIEGKPRAKAIMAVKESLGYAIDLIDFKPEYRSLLLITFFLHRIVNIIGYLMGVKKEPW